MEIMVSKILKKTISIEEVIQTCIYSIYKTTDLAEDLVLKGGQALRIVEQVSDRFSTDLDFSVSDEIKQYKIFFEHLDNALLEGFKSLGFHIFDFKYERRPEITKRGFPDTWKGWQYSFKIIENEKSHLEIEKRRRESLRPIGAGGSTITFDISEFEYCGSSQKLKIKDGVEIIAYSRPLLAVEKIRALCQKHKDYKYGKEHHLPRARDYFDIEKLYAKSLKKGEGDIFIKEAAKVLIPCFSKKEVDIEILDKIFEKDFLTVQENDWKSVTSTVKDADSFEYYVEILKQVIERIKELL